MELFKTVRGPGEAEVIIEKSKFIAHVRPVSTREEADAFLEAVRKKYKDATHNVPAFVIGDKFQIQWGSDDGEPQGTSGAPMVQLLVKEGITNVAVVVTRYFGGIKLGTGGLVRAYTGAAKLGLEAAGVCSVVETVRLKASVDYSHIAKIQNIAAGSLPDEGGSGSFMITGTEYTEKVTFDLVMLPEDRDAVVSNLGNITAGGMDILEEETALSAV